MHALVLIVMEAGEGGGRSRGGGLGQVCSGSNPAVSISGVRANGAIESNGHSNTQEQLTSRDCSHACLFDSAAEGRCSEEGAREVRKEVLWRPEVLLQVGHLGRKG